MFSEMWNVKLYLNLWETNKAHVHFCSVHLGNWPFFISCNCLPNKTQNKDHNVAFLCISFSLSLKTKSKQQQQQKALCICLFLFLIFIILEFQAYKRCQSNSPESNFPGWTWRWKITSLTKPGLWGQFNQHYEESSEKLCQPCLQKCFCVAGTTDCYKLDRSQHKAEATEMALFYSAFSDSAPHNETRSSPRWSEQELILFNAGRSTEQNGF